MWPKYAIILFVTKKYAFLCINRVNNSAARPLRLKTRSSTFPLFMSRVVPSFDLCFFNIYLIFVCFFFLDDSRFCLRNRPLFQRDDKKCARFDEIAHMPSFAICSKTISIYLSSLYGCSLKFYVYCAMERFWGICSLFGD